MLTVKFDGTDFSLEQSRFEWIPSTISFDGSKELLLGFKKPIGALFINVTAQSISKKLSLKYWNGSAYTAVSGLLDLSLGLKQSGFVRWTKPTNQEKNTESGLEQYWLKINLTETSGDALASSQSIVFKGINLVFSDDFDLQGEFPTIMQHLPEGAETFIRFHEAARDLLITDLRREGVVIQGELRKQIDQWDLLDIDEIREASKHATLAKIFHWKSDEVDDKWTDLAKNHEAQAGASLTPLMSIDSNDNGKKDEDETVKAKPIIIGRL